MLLLLLGMAGTLGACAPVARAGSLPPTLSLTAVGGAQIAIQNGIPVPTFDRQPRRTVTLDGQWRVERVVFDADLSLTDRETSLPGIMAEAAGREAPTFRDGTWETLAVPGSLNPPPERRETGGWYRRQFLVPATWDGMSAVLKMEAVNYIGDVWINGAWVGYHEGGYTPFAFDVSPQLIPGAINTIAVRVDNPAWGSRNDILPWGLADWWNYGGITGSAWIEATPSTAVIRADVVPHLDGIDVRAVVQQPPTAIGAPPAEDEVAAASVAATSSASPSETPSGTPSATPAGAADDAGLRVRFRIFPAELRPDNLTNPYARTLVPAGAAPIATHDVDLDQLAAGEMALAEASFLMGGPDLWTPAQPALYVLQTSIVDGATRLDATWSTFGLRHVTVDPERPRLLLNGRPVMLVGVGLHDEVLEPGETETARSAHRARSPVQLLAQLGRARDVGATLIRAGHTPANPMLLMLADRLGFAVWEEIPLYHYTPLTFGIAIDRGIAEQMLREMALRDMNRPSVFFHGLANESTGVEEREEALEILHKADREIDGTRLTGQAAYGFQPDDATQGPLDVAGYTLYHGVFYGTDAAAGTAAALETAHATYPDKPILALEFGRWSDDARGLTAQRSIFDDTFAELLRRSDRRVGGYVAAAVWWTLEDYTTRQPGIAIEHFGLYDGLGQLRPAGEAAATAFGQVAGGDRELGIESSVRRAEAVQETRDGPQLLLFVGYGILAVVAILGGILAALVGRGGRSVGRGVRSAR